MVRDHEATSSSLVIWTNKQGNARVGELGRTVNPLLLAEWVQIPLSLPKSPSNMGGKLHTMAEKERRHSACLARSDLDCVRLTVHGQILVQDSCSKQTIPIIV